MIFNMPDTATAETPKVMEKVFNILKRELSAEEYLIYLKAITQYNPDDTCTCYTAG